MPEAVILSGARTPVGKLGGVLKDFSAVELGKFAGRAAIDRSGASPQVIEEAIMGNVLQAGLGQNPARQVALGSGIPDAVSAMTVNKVCGSGLQAVVSACQEIRLGEIDLALAGGMESMTNSPYLLPGARRGYRLGNADLVDSVIHDGLLCAFEGWQMGCTGEVVAELYKIPRSAQDEYALSSHERANAARNRGLFENEIVSVEVRDGKHGARLVCDDEGPRPDVTLESLAKLRPAFKEGGTVTAGNASSINDGAAALVIASVDFARKSGLSPLARVVSYATSGVEPRMVMMAPVPAIRKTLERARWDIAEVDLFEINEAFAVQMVAIMNDLGLDRERVNVNGGAIAVGHPIGASGARILLALVNEMRRRNAKKGIAALCLGGGNAVAMAVER